MPSSRLDRLNRTLLHTLGEIVEERVRQDAKFGDQADRPPTDWLAILGEEFGEVSREVCETLDLPGLRETAAETEAAEIEFDNHRLNMRRELIQTAAVAVAMVQTGDLMGWWPTTTK